MSVNSITGGGTSFQIQSLTSAVSSDQQIPAASSTNDQSSNKAAQAKAVDANAANDISLAKNNNLANSNNPLKQALVAKNSTSKPAGVVSHVVVSYNYQGKMRTRFEDSRNNVVYQIPSEMVAKMEDLMMKQETTTDIKG